MMGRVKISSNCGEESTNVSNIFIDEYMQDANDAQIKIYLFLLRMMSSNLPTSVTALADKFNHTESDVLRSLKYWENKGLISLEYDSSQNLTGIHMEDIVTKAQRKYGRRRSDLTEAPTAVQIPSPASVPVPVAESVAALTPLSVAMPADDVTSLSVAAASVNRASVSAVGYTAPSVVAKESPVPEKPTYTAAQLTAFSESDGSGLLFLAESYYGRPLTATEMSTVYYIHEELGFSEDLCDYLMQYCAGNHKQDFRYMEKVAINWKQKNISTPKQARLETFSHDSNIMTIMRSLGLENSPTEKEGNFISRWLGELGFTMEIILDACDRTVMATQKNRLKYCDSILRSWHDSKVTSKEDIKKLDENHTAELTKKKQKAVISSIDSKIRLDGSSIRSGVNQNRFNQFQQNTYNFVELEEKLLDN